MLNLWCIALLPRRYPNHRCFIVLRALFWRFLEVLTGCFGLWFFSFQLEDEALKYIGAHCPELVTLNLQTCLVSKPPSDVPAQASRCVWSRTPRSVPQTSSVRTGQSSVYETFKNSWWKAAFWERWISLQGSVTAFSVSGLSPCPAHGASKLLCGTSWKNSFHGARVFVWWCSRAVPPGFFIKLNQAQFPRTEGRQSSYSAVPKMYIYAKKNQLEWARCACSRAVVWRSEELDSSFAMEWGEDLGAMGGPFPTPGSSFTSYYTGGRPVPIP